MTRRVLHAGLEWCYWGTLEPDCLDNPKRGQVAGGETAMLRAAFETAARGWDVAVASKVVPGRHRGVRFERSESFYDLAIDERWDAVVIWGDPDPLALLSACGALDGVIRVCAQQCNGFTRRDAVQGYVDRYVSPSRTHADMLAARYGIPSTKFWVIPNGVEPARFSWDRPRDPFAVYHASSPDRGLHHLLELWPEIRRREPRATLDVFYEVQRFVDSVLRGRSGVAHPIMVDLVRRLVAAIDRVTHGRGVTFRGAAPQQEVIDRACTAGVMCYPCDPVIFTEGFGTSVLESYVAGAAPVTTDADAFGAVYGELFPLIPRARIREQLVDAVLDGIESARRAVDAGRAGVSFVIAADGMALAEKFAWSRVSERWSTLLEAEIESRATSRAAA